MNNIVKNSIGIVIYWHTLCSEFTTCCRVFGSAEASGIVAVVVAGMINKGELFLA
jgi:hypothetical protein